MAYTLRPHQEDIIDQMMGAITFGDTKLMIDCPPAYGKSLLLAEMARLNKDDGVIIVISITALLTQIAHHLDEQGVEYSILKADYTSHFDPDCKVQLVMAQTLHARLSKISFTHKFKIWQMDEGHVAHPDISKRTRECLDFINPEITILYSGTPFTSEGYAFSGYDYLSNLKAQELQDQGFLCPIKYFIPKWSEEIDYSSIKSTTNDYNTVELDTIINTTSHLNLALESMNQMNAKNKKTLIFCSSIEQADNFEKILRKDGYKARAFHSKTNKQLSPLIIDSFIKNKSMLEPGEEDKHLFNFDKAQIDTGETINCLLSIGKISIGFDCPDVQLGVQLRPTKSLPLYIQQVCRLARNHKSKEYAEYLDLGATVSSFGFHTDIFIPVEKDLFNPDVSKLALEKAKDKLALEDLSVIIDSSEPVEMTREHYNLSMQELKSKIASADKESMSIHDMIKSFQLAKEAITIIIIGSQIMTRAYGDPISKAGRKYKYDPMWIHEEWEKAFSKYPEKQAQWTRALKTRAGNIIKEEKNFNSLKFFIDFLVQNYLEEDISMVNQYQKKDLNKYNIPGVEDIDLSDVPF